MSLNVTIPLWYNIKYRNVYQRHPSPGVFFCVGFNRRRMRRRDIEKEGGDVANVDRVEVFCNEYIKTNSQRKAYRAAYPSSEKWKDATVDSKASVFAKTGKVLERLAELRSEAAEDNKVDRNNIISQLKSIGFADIDPDNIKASDKLKALDILSRMLGLDKPTGQTDEDRMADKFRDIFGDADADE